ncbi:MAG: transcriptional repressor LexA, partial [bacterium]
MLTKRQKQIFDYIKKFIKEKDYAPSLDEIRRHFRLSSKSTIHQHIEALKLKGRLAKLDYQARSIEISESKKTKLAEIPLLGTIAAGQPIEALENPDVIQVPQDYIGKYGNYYALRVQGNSMIDEGVFDGDTVIIRQQKIADDGQMVVAIIDDNQATLKKIYREKDRIRLQPANPSLFPIYRKEVEIRGIVAQIIRNLESRLEGDKFKRRIDYSWDFNGAKTKPYTHGLHTYPAMFIPQVARRLLLTYSQKNDTICDIFCGSGTALIESRLLSRNSFGIDLNPLAVFLAEVKTTPLNPQSLEKEYIKLIAKINKIKNTEIKKPQFKNLEFWFKNKVIIQLAKIKKAIKEIKNKKIQDFFMVAFSETVRKSSNTKSGEFKLVRIKKEDLERYSPNVLEIFQQKAEFNIKAMEEFYRDVDKNTLAKIIFGDASKNNGIKENSIDCVITSPPYGDSRTTVAYGQFSRLSAQWLGIFDNP